MKNFVHWGIKRRIFPEKNYNALWNGANFKTIRFGTGVAEQMDPGFQEFYDVAITTRCNLSCQFCVPGTTSVSTPDGQKEIASLKIGDNVHSYDHSSSSIRSNKVVQTFKRPYVGNLIEMKTDKKTLRLTPNHKVFTVNRGYVEAQDLTIEDDILNNRIKRIKTIKYVGFVYNIAVENDNNYFANSILVHNCYVAAGKGGEHFESISETWKKWMSHPMYFEEKGVRKDDEILQALTLGREIPLDKLPVTYTNKPFQIAIGSTGEPTIHPDFCKFLETVYETNVVPNYTTNGLVLASETKERDALLEATRNFVGGVAVSYGNELARESARKAVSVLLEKGETNVNIHHLIKDKSSVDAMIKLTQEYGDDIKYHVLLPLMQHGRSTEGMEPGTFEYLEDQILKNNIKNVAFGANFVKYLTGPDAKIKTWSYPPESLSANVILKKDQVCITPSSFNLDIIHTIDL